MHLPFVASARRSFCSLGLLLALAACGDESGTSREASPAGAVEQAGAGSLAASAAASNRLEITITGGSFAGTHQLTENVTCTADAGTWMVASSRQAGQGLTQVLLLLDRVQPTGGTSREVGLTAHFGDLMDETGTNSGSVSVDPAGGDGTGTGTVRREGQAAVIEVEGTTGDGAQLSATVRCATVAGIQ